MKNAIGWGQWLGEAFGSNNAKLILNIDKDRPDTGVIYFSEARRDLSSFKATIRFRLEKKDLIGEIYEFKPLNTAINKYAMLPSFAEIRFSEFTKSNLAGSWKADNGQQGTFTLSLRENVSSSIKSKNMEWDDFLTFSIQAKRKNHNLIFRGQPDSKFPLRTSFHRTYRRDLNRYVCEDMINLNKYLALSEGYSFDLNNPKDFSQLLSLAQHHGYPTPLLDWSRSPLVAAFFAFNTVTENETDGYVRIYALNLAKWNQNGQNFVSNFLDEPRFSVTPLDIVSSNNMRVLPQQSVFTFSNITDIERWLMLHEEDEGEIIQAYDIDKKSRLFAMSDLEIMNINSATLFPGLDGSFGTLRERAFRRC